MGEWIKCSERLPMEPDPEVLYETVTCLVSNGVHVGTSSFDRGHNSGTPWACWNNYGDIAPGEIAYWQPLPEPPK